MAGVDALNRPDLSHASGADAGKADEHLLGSRYRTALPVEMVQRHHTNSGPILALVQPKNEAIRQAMLWNLHILVVLVAVH